VVDILNIIYKIFLETLICSLVTRVTFGPIALIVKIAYHSISSDQCVICDCGVQVSNMVTSVVTDSEFSSESANFFPVRPSPNPQIFGGRK